MTISAWALSGTYRVTAIRSMSPPEMWQVTWYPCLIFCSSTRFSRWALAWASSVKAASRALSRTERGRVASRELAISRPPRVTAQKPCSSWVMFPCFSSVARASSTSK